MPAVSQTPGLFYPDWNRTSPAEALAPGIVHVWRANLDTYRIHSDRLTASLAPDELNRASRFHFECDRMRYSVSRGLLRLLVGRYVGLRPGAISFAYTLRAKPYLPSPETLAFNLSHSHGMALYAFAHSCELGIDVERYNPEFEAESIARSFFTPEEVRFILQAPQDNRNERFFFLWSRKEAYIKARAEGLYLPLNEFDLASRSSVDGFQIQSFFTWPQFSAALAVKPPPSQIRFFDLDSPVFAP
ncbi:MAG: 4'-phosphopantetheinyl transferase superfamily protein [Acidobacteriota bacterium]|nr:4'-phosphopantetheinyl transferase superfamily protein [Acidobacteriota bacterium]